MSILKFENLTGEQLKAMFLSGKFVLQELNAEALYKLMDYETECLCLGSGDVELIESCLSLLSEKDAVTDIEAVFSMAKINEQNQDTDKAIKSVKRISFKKVAVIAVACVLAVASCAMVIAAAFGVNIFKHLDKVEKAPQGTTIIVDNFTFYHNGEPKEYTSVSEMMQAEGFDIVYPKALPNGADITDIFVLPSERNTLLLVISTSDFGISINIELDVVMDDTMLQGDEVYKKHGIDVHILNRDVCSAVFLYKGNYYSISANNYDELIYIINNLEV